MSRLRARTVSTERRLRFSWPNVLIIVSLVGLVAMLAWLAVQASQASREDAVRDRNIR